MGYRPAYQGETAARVLYGLGVNSFKKLALLPNLAQRMRTSIFPAIYINKIDEKTSLYSRSRI